MISQCAQRLPDAALVPPFAGMNQIRFDGSALGSALSAPRTGTPRSAAVTDGSEHGLTRPRPPHTSRRLALRPMHLHLGSCRRPQARYAHGRRGRPPDRDRRDRRRDGPQDPCRAVRARVGGRRGDHRRRRSGSSPGASARRPSVRDAHQGHPPGCRGGVNGMTPGQELKRLRQRAIRQLIGHEVHTPDVIPSGRRASLLAVLLTMLASGYSPSPRRPSAVTSPSSGCSRRRGPTAMSTSRRRTSPHAPRSQCRSIRPRPTSAFAGSSPTSR